MRIAQIVGSGMRIAAARWRRLLILFSGVLIPLYGFGNLAEDVWTEGGLPWDQPILRFVHGYATPQRDTFMIFVTRVGFAWGTVPLAMVILLVLLARSRVRDALFFGLAIGGAAMLNLAVKTAFHRVRPALWVSPLPETSYSFPSGHAMGSMALAAATAVLAWPTRGRWPALLLGAVFVVLVGFSRVYLGVHYPSDVLAAWGASVAWVTGVSTFLFGRPIKSAPGDKR